eukprot:CAMPEP_0119309462 /NCGR_PEP_ID=MMETSP1333-20130426/15782_1 /TAXON_ID=418940 /ORGANISM="Scyphosphaera apsteinii, Strain RCC1455" /LENGTH=690 /DNA_ID=CAMNT_0007313449 /DNA_START=288 /DNA_END=2360 /DNA_ORIENTATION=+
MQSEEMFSFNPYKILEIEEGAEPTQIKKAYRSMSLKYHPDKCSSPECENAFIKVSKAYEVLTNEETRKNYEMYGNPDGYHGTSVTIGLPSWLTNKENELAILVAYFVVLIVVIPVVVGLWWRNSSKFLEDGVMQNTAYRFYRQVQENTAAKFMPGILASAVEFCEGVPCKNNQADDLSRLHKRVQENFVKNQGDMNNDIMKVKTLIYAHLLREPIPASLLDDTNYCLEHSHRLLNGLLNIVIEQRFVTATMNVIEFSQLLTQALWFHSNPLLQLPHFDMQQVKHATRVLSNIKDKDKAAGSPIERLKQLGGEKRREALKGLGPEQHADIDVYLANFPDIEISFDAKVEDEEDVQEGDVLNLTVKVERKHLQADPDWVDSDDEDEEPDESIFDKQLEAYEPGSEEYESKKEDLMDEWRDAYFERQKKKREREKKRNPQTGELGFAAKPLHDPVPVHAPFFPYERFEQWMVLLVDVKSNKLVGYQKLSQNSRFEKVQLKFLAPKEGVVHYEIHAMCSAYLGADKKVLMKKTITKKKEEEVKTAAELAEDEDEEEEEEEEEPEGKWYYLGGNSIGELILNIIALGIAGVMLFNFLYARGLWQKYVQPPVDWILKILAPFLNFVSMYTSPAALWFTANVYDFRHVAFLFENMTAANVSDANATLSTRVVKNDTSFLNEDPFKANLFNMGVRDEL